MERNLSLLKSSGQGKRREKRAFPRVPFPFLVFRTEENSFRHTFEVRDISPRGMRLCLKDGPHSYRPSAPIGGRLRLGKISLKLRGKVVWAQEPCLGVSFGDDPHMECALGKFLAEEEGKYPLRPLHDLVSMPRGGPRYWYRTDRGSELLVWLMENGGVKTLRILLPGVLVEWNEDKGLETGTPRYLREGPSAHGEEEYLVEFDSPPDTSKLAWGRTLLSQIAQDHLPREIGDFLLAKMAPRKDPGLNNTETKREAS